MLESLFSFSLMDGALTNLGSTRS